MLDEKRQADIAELDEAATRLRASWKKLHNYVISFTTILMEARATFETTDYGLDKYGKPWTFTDWLGFKAGLIENQVFRLLDQFEKRLASEDREIIAAEKLKRVAAKNAAADERRKQAEARREESKARKAAKEAERTQALAEKERKRLERIEAKQRIAAQAMAEAQPRLALRDKKIATSGIAQVFEARDKGEITVTAAETIARLKGADPQTTNAMQLAALEKELARRNKQSNRTRGPNRPADIIQLEKATNVAKPAAKEAKMALDLDTCEGRREKHRRYGAALQAIRKLIPSNSAFSAHLKANGLEVGDAPYRSNAMWLANHWEELVLDDCPYAHPGDIRKWLLQRGCLREFPKTDSDETASIH